jgi:hypothetical protein
VIALRVLGIGLELAPGTHPDDLRAAAVDAARLIESALTVERLDSCRIFTACELSALAMLADTVASLIEAAAEIEQGARR